jgi:hypothetical protein
LQRESLLFLARWIKKQSLYKRVPWVANCYTEKLFDTRSGEENVEIISSQNSEYLDLVGIIIYGENKKVDKALDGLKFHE